MNLLDLLPRHRVRSYPSVISDHFPVLLEWKEEPASSFLPFKFNHSWLTDDAFVKMVRDELPYLSHGDPVFAMDGLSKKLRLLKRKVKSWTHKKTLAMKEKILFIEEEIQKLLGSSVSGLLSTLENIRLSTLRVEL